MQRKVNVVEDLDGNKIVVIHDIRFKGKRSVEWTDVEQYLKQYVGEAHIIDSTNDMVYIGVDLPEEYAHSNYTNTLKGANAKAKANAAQAVGELIQIAKNKSSAPDYNSKHGNKAKFGWYRYDTRIALPIYNSNNELERYNIYNLRMLVRHDKDGKSYLYDFLRTKKETSSPLQ